jgi:hypothetical protein
MSGIGSWIGRHRVAAGFAAGALVTLVAVAAVVYFVLADQQRSARVLAAALTQAFDRAVRIERVTELGPSRVVMKGVQLSAKAGWPADIVAETVEASGPLLAAVRGDPAPVRVQVTRPTVAAGGAGGAAAIEEVRQALATFLANPMQLDLALIDGTLEAPGAASAGVVFDATVRKGSGDVRGEIVLRDPAGSRFVLRLEAQPDGDTVRLVAAGDGPLGPLAPWAPASVVRAAGAASARFRAEVGLEPGDRVTGRVDNQLGDLTTLRGTLSFHDGLLSMKELQGSADLAFVATATGLADPVPGRVELSGGEASWSPARGGWPSARGDLRVPEAKLPPSLAGMEVGVGGAETGFALEPREGHAVVRGELRGGRVEAAGLEAAPVATSWQVDLDDGGALSRMELAGLTARVLGVPVRGTAAYDAVRARADVRLETTSARLDPLVRRLGPDWLGPSDRLQAASIRMTASDLDLRGWTDGKADVEVRELVLRQPDGETRLDRARVRGTAQAGGAAVTLEADGVKGAAPHLEGRIARVDGSADLVRIADAGAGLARARLVAKDDQGREMLQADLARQSPGDTGPVRLSARLPALERLAPLWPSVQRQVTGSAMVELQAPDVGLGTYEGRLTLEVPTAELLDGSVSLRDVSADVPVRRGGPAPTAGAPPGGSLTVGELIGYGVVLYDVSGRARVADQEVTLDDLRYLLYSGQGRGTASLTLAADGLSGKAELTGEGVRIEEFMAAYGVRGGTMTGLLRYDLNVRYQGNRLGADGGMSVPEGGTVTIELLDRFLEYASADPTGVVRRALGNLRAFDFRSAEATVRTASDDIRVSLSLRGRERFGIFPPRVREINVRDMPMGFLARQFPAY